ncbi:hypothetical protein WJ438_23815 [Streptomyces sp. GD-15H]|uniref:hypothetical protein n=1 Tax=Streptomyces sp. GD-15H TaxID=3129112 RepID=UPI00324B9B5C
MDFTVLANAVEVDHGIKRVSMRFIKRYADPSRTRLSPELNKKITQALSEQGLVTLPRTLPTNEEAFVFVVQKDSVLGEALDLCAAIALMTKVGLLADLEEGHARIITESR